MEEKREEGRCRILYNQMNNASTKEVRAVKMEMVERLNKRYQVDIDLFAEVGNNWRADGCKDNLANWFVQDNEKIKYVAACNEYDKARTSRHQPGRTAIAVRGAMTQYAKTSSKDNMNWGDSVHIRSGLIQNTSAGWLWPTTSARANPRD